jgi:hypothetical protein
MTRFILCFKQEASFIFNKGLMKLRELQRVLPQQS